MAMARDSSLAKLPTAAKVAVGGGLLLLIGVAYFVVFYTDLQSSIKAAENQEQKLRSELSEARKSEFAYQRDLAEVTDRQQRQREYNKILPATTEAPAFLSSIQNVANIAGVGLTAWNPLPEVTEQFYARIPMKLELSGRYHQIAKFFHGVGQLDRIINVENISIREPKKSGEDIVVKVDALATAFRTLPEGATPKRDKRAKKEGR
jgi:type IV pilus assembly protein PilO